LFHKNDNLLVWKYTVIFVQAYSRTDDVFY
jgi:hypothetical protein